MAPPGDPFMPTLWECAQGHRWEPAPGETGAPLESTQACPVCGAAGTARDVEPDGTIHLGSHRSSLAPQPIEEFPATLAPAQESPRVGSSFTGTIEGYEILGELG